MKRLFPIFIFVFFSISFFAQTAPHFTITDTDGNTISLYDDYLNHGDIVVIDMFFVICPVCKPYNAPFQALYEELGEGESGVQFLLLTTKTWDNNEAVANYRTEYGLTYPGAGNNGGGYAATQPYRDGLYGSYWGAPTFVVIAPDGTVFYNPPGSGVEGRIAAIKQQIQDIKDGNYEKESSTIVNVDLSTYLPNTSLPDYQLKLRSADDYANSYDVPASFVYPSNDYPEVSNPEIYVEIPGIENTDITTFDLVTIQRFIIGLQTFDNYQILASDVNGSGTVTATDLLSMRKLILGISDNFAVNRSYLALNTGCETSLESCGEGAGIDTELAEQNISLKILKFGNVR